jgi:hypothetical protein
MAKIYGSSEIWGDLLVTGSFSILGSASSIYTTSLVVSDTIIALGHSQSGAPLLDEGIMFTRGTGLTQAFIWDETNDTFALIGTNDDHTVIGSVNIDSYSNLRVGGITTSNITITDGATSGYVLTSDASGNATWQASVGGTTPSLSQVLAVGNSSGVNNIILPTPSYIGFTSSSYTMRLFPTTLTANWSIIMPNNGGTMALVSDIPTSVVTGTGTTNYLPKWSSSTDLTNSLIYDNGTNVFIGTTLSSSDTQLYIRKNNTTIRTGIHSEISSGTYSIAISGNIGSSLGFGSGDVGVLGNIGTSTASTTFAIYARNTGSNTNSYGVYTTLTLSTTTYGMYTTITSGTAGSYYGNYVTIGTGVSNNTFGTNNWGSYISNLGNASTNTGLYTQVNNGSFANNALWAVVGNSPTYSSGDKAVFAWVSTTATNTTDSSYAGYFNNSSKTTSSSYGLYSLVSSTQSSANYGLFVQTSGSSINYGVVVNTGTSIFNEAGDANTDFRIEGDTNANLFFADASTDRVGIKTNTPTYDFTVVGTASATALRGNFLRIQGTSTIAEFGYTTGEKNIEFTTNSNGSEIKFNNSGTITAGTSSITQYPSYFSMLTSSRSYFNLRDDGDGLLTFGDISENDQIRFYMTGGSGTVSTVGGSGVYIAYNLRVNGTLSKAAGTFQIDHPLPELKETHTLLHSFVEAPQANNIYRGKSQLVNGFIEINLDEQFNMTEGTLVALNKNFQCFTSNETGWDAVKGIVIGNKLQINCINSNSSDEISWLVIGERHDDYILSSGLYDINGEFIVEKPKV